MHYQPVVDPIARSNPLDRLGAILFVAVFILVAIATGRRPIFGLCALVALIPFAFHVLALDAASLSAELARGPAEAPACA